MSIEIALNSEDPEILLSRCRRPPAESGYTIILTPEERDSFPQKDEFQ